MSRGVFNHKALGETLKKNTIGHAAHFMMYAVALSVFLPYYLSATVIILVAISFCILPGTRDKIFCHKGSFLLLLFLLMTTVVSILYGNKTGLVRTGVFAAMMVVTLVSKGLATKKYYERLLDCFIIGASLSTVGCIIEKILHSDDPHYRCKTFFTRSPPQTRDSLLAMATRFPAFSADSSGMSCSGLSITDSSAFID